MEDAAAQDHPDHQQPGGFDEEEARKSAGGQVFSRQQRLPGGSPQRFLAFSRGRGIALTEGEHGQGGVIGHVYGCPDAHQDQGQGCRLWMGLPVQAQQGEIHHHRRRDGDHIQQAHVAQRQKPV